MRLKRREKKLLIFMAIAVASIAAYLLMVEPFLKGQASLKADIMQKEAMLDKYRTIVARKEQFLGRREFLRQKLGVLDALLLKGDKSPLVAAELQRILKSIANSLGVYIEREKILDPVKADIFLKVPVEIYTTTELSKLAELLYQIEQYKKYLIVPEVEIEADNKRSPRLVRAKLVVAGLIKTK